MGRDLSNVGKRFLNARRTCLGREDALENMAGLAIQDGAQCFVTVEQANYRFLKASQLDADGRFVVKPAGGHGRWIRESGLVGFAMLEGGKLETDSQWFANYQQRDLVQFEESADHLALYVGSTPR